MKILPGEGIKASKVGYFRHESNVRDAHIDKNSNKRGKNGIYIREYEYNKFGTDHDDLGKNSSVFNKNLPKIFCFQKISSG